MRLIDGKLTLMDIKLLLCIHFMIQVLKVPVDAFTIFNPNTTSRYGRIDKQDTCRVRMYSKTTSTSSSRTSTSTSTSYIDNSTSSPSKNNINSNATTTTTTTTNNNRNNSNKPHEQRVKEQRKARRLNHSFMHLYRHDNSLFDDQMIAPSSKSMTDPKTYLLEYGFKKENNEDQQGILAKEIIVHKMSQEFPPLLELDVKRHLRPKLRFLKYTLGYNNLSSNITLASIPPQYFGSRLEKVIAPRHAFLVSKGLPHGKMLLENDCELFKEFLFSCRRLKSFCVLCNQWKQKYGEKFHDEHYEQIDLSIDDDDDNNNNNISNKVNKELGTFVTAQEVEAFDALFTRGIMAAARGDMDPQNQHLQHCNITSGQMVYLLIKHGANPFETDVRDISLLHWAAGSGELSALTELIRSTCNGGVEEAVQIIAERDGATILHWASAGAKAKGFGTGGHPDVCKYLLDNCGGPSQQKDIVNTVTRDGNSVLMWAAWSGSIEIVKLMIRHRADPLVTNRNGCTVAHWAASAGIVEICDYLYNTINIDFDVKNKNGNTPLSHAVAYGRADVVKWLREEVKVNDDGAAELALDFVDWEENNVERKKVLRLFDDDWF